MSGGYVWYNQRPNKAVERQLLMDLLVRLNRRLPISNYQYITFGGAYFEDIKLIHTFFGNQRLISIEGDENIFNRQLFNLPYSCVTAENCLSGDFISQRFDDSVPTICWLDYASPSEIFVQLQEFQMLLGRLSMYDIVKITVNANPASLGTGSEIQNADGTRRQRSNQEIQEHRLQRISDRIGDLLPHGTTAADMNKQLYPNVLNRAIGIAASRIIESINTGWRFQPLTSFVYGDSEHQMLTVTGIILDTEELDDFLFDCQLESWDLFTGIWGETNVIRLPALTTREKFALDQKIPCDDVNEMSEALSFMFDPDESINQEILSSYKMYYRHYPSFHRVSY